MATTGELVLRDVHLPAAPSWWPPAPGWWLLALVVLVLLAGACLRSWLRRRRQRRWRQLFEQACVGAAQGNAVGAMSELLRRAARRVSAQADRLQGEDWLRFLDGDGPPRFSQGPGRLLLDGGFRPRVEAGEVAELQAVALARFLQLMAGRR